MIFAADLMGGQATALSLTSERASSAPFVSNIMLPPRRWGAGFFCLVDAQVQPSSVADRVMWIKSITLLFSSLSALFLLLPLIYFQSLPCLRIRSSTLVTVQSFTSFFVLPSLPRFDYGGHLPPSQSPPYLSLYLVETIRCQAFMFSISLVSASIIQLCILR